MWEKRKRKKEKKKEKKEKEKKKGKEGGKKEERKRKEEKKKKRKKKEEKNLNITRFFQGFYQKKPQKKSQKGSLPPPTIISGVSDGDFLLGKMSPSLLHGRGFIVVNQVPRFTSLVLTGSLHFRTLLLLDQIYTLTG